MLFVIGCPEHDIAAGVPYIQAGLKGLSDQHAELPPLQRLEHYLRLAAEAEAAAEHAKDPETRHYLSTIAKSWRRLAEHVQSADG